MKSNPLTLLLSFLFLGAYSLTAQVLIIREFLVIFYGNELCLGLVFGGWFVGIALGAGIGGACLRDDEEGVKGNSSNKALNQYLGLMLASPIVLIAQIVAIRGVRGFLGIPPGESIALASMTVASMVLVAPFSALVGAMFPAACVYLGGGARGIGRVYVWEAVGSMSGGLLLTFFLIQRASPLLIIGFFAVGASACVIALCKQWLYSWKAIGAMALISAFAVMAAAGGWSWIAQASAHKRWNDLNPGMRLVESIDSVYQHIDIGSFDGQISLYGNGQLISTFPDPYRSAPTAHLSLSAHPAPMDVLIMGTATGDLLEEMLLYPLQKLHVVELDDQLLAMELKYQDERYRKAWNDPRVRIFYDDGRRFIQRQVESYDVILVNVPEPSNALLNRLYTREFYQEAQRRLKPGGILITGASLAVDYVGGDIGLYAASIFRTLKTIFPQVMAVPGERALFFAANREGAVSLDPQVLGHRFLHNKIRSDYFSEHYFESMLPMDRIQFLQRSIEGVKEYRINSDAQPVAYFYNIILWELFSASQSRDKASALRTLAWLDVRVILLSLAILTGLRILYVAPWKRAGSQRATFNAMLAIASTGIAAMSAEMVLLLSYQNIYGYLYHRVGLVVASFMLGLALGGWAMSRKLQYLKDARLSLIVMQLLVAGYMFILPLLVALSRWSFSFAWAYTAELIFMTWVGIAGMLTGAVFPLAGAVYLSRRPRTGEAAGWIDAMDHVGAFFGAVLTGTFFLPLMGTLQTCAVVGAINGVCAFLLVVDKITSPEGSVPMVGAASP